MRTGLQFRRLIFRHILGLTARRISARKFVFVFFIYSEKLIFSRAQRNMLFYSRRKGYRDSGCPARRPYGLERFARWALSKIPRQWCGKGCDTLFTGTPDDYQGVPVFLRSQWFVKEFWTTARWECPLSYSQDATVDQPLFCPGSYIAIVQTYSIVFYHISAGLEGLSIYRSDLLTGFWLYCSVLWYYTAGQYDKELVLLLRVS